ncbi:putative C6 finger domain protein [Aspergillus nomiae NRRL 13137]|uniref:Putative C6 finger domain protein n=1 Tax=Aspergillus nomiae NRRL (strain ATCC 15546 / NRRL 13137 / CBS 260.88 / M93) TaxID=1509407 RepID=A0A0L1J1V7_ASPN3|nr:putative C6 finger domain protein [Aspergillus nomiae NRRL 13137]KNG85791.1 putative C6 finger domain protein [Aspergillus nomiae NRRL 13137]
MSSEHGDRQSNDQPNPTLTAKLGARKKIRPTYSCLNCHKRKVKCDRVKPCGACCLRGTPSECEYGTSKKDRHYIEQSALIENLMQTCESLKRQLAEARQLANLPPVKAEETGSSSLYQIKPNDSDEEEPGEQAAHPGQARRDSPDPSGVSTGDITGSQRESSPTSLSRQKAILNDPALASTVMELFVDRLIRNFSPDDHQKYGGTIALREASDMRMISPMLCNAFEATALTFAGRRDGNRSVELAGHAKYVRTLRQLQAALYDTEGNKSTEVLVVVLLSTITELGGLELLRTRSAYRHRYGIERSLFVDLRLYWVTAALVHRKPSFLASKDWLTVPWAGDAPAKDILQHLLDIAVDIPGYLSRIDEFSAMVDRAAVCTFELTGMQSSIWQQATELQARLNLWKAAYADTYPAGTAWEAYDTESADGFPIFQCRNTSTMSVTVAKILHYPDILLATSMCFYWALSLVVSMSDSGLVSVLGPQQRYQFACDICRSMKYYINNIPGYLMSRIMFVLRTAFDAFSPGMIEKEFIAELFQYIGRKLEFTVFSNKCASSAVKSEST